MFDLGLADGRRLALRLHRTGYQSRGGIDAELNWTEALARKGFPCPRPARTASGTLTATDGEGVASAVQWLDAVPLSALEPSPAERRALMRGTGALLAALHGTSDGIPAPAPCLRLAWHRGGLTGPNPLWGRFWESTGARGDEAAALRRARDRAALWLRDWAASAPADIGPIHADALQENVMRAPDGRLWLIDFDDCGPGYRLYDPGAALVQFWDDPLLPEWTAAMAEGYAAGRGLDAREVADLLPRFTALRALASAGWLMSRAPADDPRHATYVRRALTLSRAFG